MDESAVESGFVELESRYRDLVQAIRETPHEERAARLGLALLFLDPLCKSMAQPIIPAPLAGPRGSATPPAAATPVTTTMSCLACSKNVTVSYP